MKFLRSETSLEMWQLVRPYRRAILKFIVLIFVAAALETIGLGLVIPIVHALTNPENSSKLVEYVGVVYGAASVESAAVFLAGVLFFAIAAKEGVMLYKGAFATTLSLSVRNRVRQQMTYQYLLSERPPNEYRSHGALLNTILDQSRSCGKFVRAAVELLTGAVFAAFLLGLSLAVSWRLTSVIAATFVLIAVATRSPFKKWAHGLARKGLKVAQQQTALLSQTLLGSRHVKILSAERQALSVLTELDNLQLDIQRREAVLNSAPSSLNNIVAAALVLAGCAYLLLGSDVSLAEALPIVGLFLVVSQRLSGIFGSMTGRWIALRSSYPALLLILRSLHEARDPKPTHSCEEFQGFHREILLENVTFAYPHGKQVVQDFNLRIPKGSFVVMQGKSGTGKSTIADLVLRMRSPNSGRMLVDGRNADSYSLQSWRKRIGYVSQIPFIFDGTVRQNIMIGKPDATDAEVEMAARLADAHTFISVLPEGYATKIGGGGADLSGGQRQRLAIAQVLIRDPDLIVLDEPTSALDASAREEVFNTIVSLHRQKRTILLISHDSEIIKAAAQRIELNEPAEATV